MPDPYMIITGPDGIDVICTTHMVSWNKFLAICVPDRVIDGCFPMSVGYIVGDIAEYVEGMSNRALNNIDVREE